MVQDAHIIQYADDTLIYSADKNYLNSNSEKSQTSNDFFTSSKCFILLLTPTKLNLSFFCKKWQNVQTPVEIIIKGEKITPSNSIKYLGVTLDRNLTYQNEVKLI